MRIFHHHSLSSIHSEQSLALTIGMFDGLHLGHQRMLKELRELAKKKNLLPAVWSFSSHNHKKNSSQIISEEKRNQYLKKEGVLELHRVDFIPEVSELNAEQFLKEILIKKLHVKAILIGENASLGKNRHCNATQFKELGHKYAIDVQICSLKKTEDGLISSTAIRKALQEGNFDDAKKMLGRPWTIEGTVVEDQKKGREIGFPTANINLQHQTVPPFGVYRCSVSCPSKGLVRQPAIANIGQRPTLTKKGTIFLEVHVPNWSGDLYGKELLVEDFHFSRKEKKFNSVEALKKQIQLDLKLLGF